MATAAGPSQTFHASALGVRLVGAALAGSGAGVGLGVAGKWAEPGRVAAAGGLALGCWLFAALAGVALLGAFTGGRIDRLAPAVLAGSFGRMLLALTMGLGLYFLAQPDGKAFWIAFLLAGLVSLLAETAWAMKVLHRFQSAAATAAKGGA